MNKNWKWELIAKHGSLTEGPAWDGSGLLYNECYALTSYRWNPKSGKIEVLAVGDESGERDEV